MATTVTTHEAKTNLSRLIARAKAGEDIVIANRTIPQVRLVPVDPEPKPKRVFGALKGKIHLDESFFDPLPRKSCGLGRAGETPARHACVDLVVRG